MRDYLIPRHVDYALEISSRGNCIFTNLSYYIYQNHYLKSSPLLQMNLKLTQLLQNTFARWLLTKREKFKINILRAEFASDDPNNSSPLLFHAVRTLILKLWYLHRDEHLVPLCNQGCMLELSHKPKHTSLWKHSQGICCVNSPQLFLKHCRQMSQILT